MRNGWQKAGSRGNQDPGSANWLGDYHLDQAGEAASFKGPSYLRERITRIPRFQTQCAGTRGRKAEARNGEAHQPSEKSLLVLQAQPTGLVAQPNPEAHLQH